MGSSLASTEGLTELETKFVEAITGAAMGNGTEACRMAGYTGKDASLAVQANRLLKKAKVQSAIHSANEQVRSMAIATRREVQMGLTAIARGEVERELVFTPLGGPVFLPEPDQQGNPIHYSKPVPAQSRLGAYETLAKMFGMLVSKVEIANASDRFRKNYENVLRRVKAGDITDPKEALQELLKALGG